MNPLYYVVYFGVIGGGLVAARALGKREAKTDWIETLDMRDRIQRVFDGGACQAYERFEAIARRLSDSLSAHSSAHQFTMAQLDRTMTAANGAYAHLGDAVADRSAGSAKLQNALAEFCRRYSELVLMVGDVAQQSGYWIAPDERFHCWMQDDLAFSRELMRLTMEPEYLPLLRAVRGIFGDDGFMASLSLKGIAASGSDELLRQAMPPVDVNVSPALRRAQRLAVH